MKKYLATFLITLAVFLFQATTVQALTTTDEDDNELRARFFIDKDTSVVSLDLLWKMYGDVCNVYIIAGNSAGLTVSKECKDTDIIRGNIVDINGRGTTPLVKGGYYRICIGSDKYPADRQLCHFEQAPGGTTYATPADPTTPRVTRPSGDVPADRNIPKAVRDVFGMVEPPEFIDKIGFGEFGISKVLGVIVDLIYIIAGIVFLFMVLISAFQWITSGGDKEAVAAARKRLTHAIIGIALLALAGVIITTLGKITGFGFYLP